MEYWYKRTLRRFFLVRLDFNTTLFQPRSQVGAGHVAHKQNKRGRCAWDWFMFETSLPHKKEKILFL